MPTHPILLENLARAHDGELLANARRAHPRIPRTTRLTTRERTAWALIKVGTRLLTPRPRATNRITIGN